MNAVSICEVVNEVAGLIFCVAFSLSLLLRAASVDYFNFRNLWTTWNNKPSHREFLLLMPRFNDLLLQLRKRHIIYH